MPDYLQTGDAAQVLDLHQLHYPLRGDGIATGCAPSHGTNAMETDVASGTVFIGGTAFSFGGDFVTHDGGGDNPRFDTVIIEDVSGTPTLSIVKGTPAPAVHAQGDDSVAFADAPYEFAAPQPPDFNDFAGAVVCTVAIPAGATDYTEATHLRDSREFSDVALNSLQARAEALLPSYDETANAPATERSIIWVTGAGSDPQGIYRHNGTAYEKAGSGLSLADIAIGADKDWAGYGVTGMRELELTDTYRVHDGRGSINLPGMHTNYADGLSAAEVGRWEAAAGEKFEVWRLDVNFKGGGHNSNFTVEIRDESDGTALASTSSLINGGASPLGTSAAGADITLRVTNSTGAAQDVAIDAKVFLVQA